MWRFPVQGFRAESHLEIPEHTKVLLDSPFAIALIGYHVSELSTKMCEKIYTASGKNSVKYSVPSKFCKCGDFMIGKFGS